MLTGGNVERRKGSRKLRFFLCGFEPPGARHTCQPSGHYDPRCDIDRFGILGNDE